MRVEVKSEKGGSHHSSASVWGFRLGTWDDAYQCDMMREADTTAVVWVWVLYWSRRRYRPLYLSPSLGGVHFRFLALTYKAFLNLWVITVMIHQPTSDYSVGAFL